MRKLFLLCIVCIAFADVPALINYQGKIADADGLPVEGELSITFRIYDAASGGSSLWEEAQTVMVLNGVYNTLLGSVSAFDEDLFDGAERYLSIQVGDDEESSSRSQLVSTPYAMSAKYLDGLSQEEIVLPYNVMFTFSDGRADHGYYVLLKSGEHWTYRTYHNDWQQKAPPPFNVTD